MLKHVLLHFRDLDSLDMEVADPMPLEIVDHPGLEPVGPTTEESGVAAPIPDSPDFEDMEDLMILEELEMAILGDGADVDEDEWIPEMCADPPPLPPPPLPPPAIPHAHPHLSHRLPVLQNFLRPHLLMVTSAALRKDRVDQLGGVSGLLSKVMATRLYVCSTS